MGLFDRLFSSGSGANSAPAKPKPRAKTETVFLDAEASSSLGDVSLMKRSNTIRHTFPGNADNPGNKEMVAEVSSMEAKVAKMSEGLPGASSTSEEVNLTGGVPKPVKKTFAQQMSPAQMEQRRKGSAVAGVNVPGGPAAIKKEKEQAAAAEASQPRITQLSNAKPGAIDPFRQMVKDLNS